MKKKILLALSVTLFCIMAFANISASAETYGDLTYEITNGEISITDCNESATGEIVIPDTIDGYPVTSIGYDAFYYCTSLTSIIIPDSVTYIGEYAFSSCTSLTSIIIPDSVTYIGSDAFAYCESLTSITIPDSVTSIGDLAFAYCTSLTNIIIPDSVTYIGEGVFSRCTNLTSITIPDSVTYIGSNAFADCTSLTNITIPDSVTSIGEYTFYMCKSLTSITIPDSVTSIGYFAFYYCNNLTDVYYSGTEEDWVRIAIERNNDPLLNATIHFTEEPESPDVLSYLTYTISNGEVTITDCNESATGEIVIPDTIDGYPVTSIGYDAFYACTSLTSIIIPDSVTSIENSAFYYCTSLTNITIPDSVTYIGSDAFADCTSLTSITIPDSVTCIGGYAFNGCDNLTDVYYGGTEEDWAKITISSDNDPLLNATIHFTEEVAPEEPVPEEPVKILGDLNGDGEVDVRDVIFLRRYIVGGYGIELK